MINDLGKVFNWTGQGDKKSFRDLKITLAIMRKYFLSVLKKVLFFFSQNLDNVLVFNFKKAFTGLLKKFYHK